MNKDEIEETLIELLGDKADIWILKNQGRVWSKINTWRLNLFIALAFGVYL